MEILNDLHMLYISLPGPIPQSASM